MHAEELAGRVRNLEVALAALSGGGHTIEDEGTPLTQRTTLNFTGAGVAVADAGGKTVVTIGGGGGGNLDDTLAIEALL